LISNTDLTQQIKDKALEIGFDAIGIAPASEMKEECRRMKDWLSQGMHADMSYLEKAVEKRIHPEKILKGAQSVIVTLTNYNPLQTQSENTFQVSKYAYGNDYHIIINKKLSDLENYLHYIYGVLHSKVYVDSSSLFEKAWAQRAGLGWVGKNSLLITKQGSFYFVGILVVDIILDYDQSYKKNECGDCTLCIDSCPTRAICKPGVVDVRKCISYHTIENRKELPAGLRDFFGNRIYGCDHCQDVCPWNKKNITGCKTKEFHPTNELLSFQIEDWKTIDKNHFDELFGSSAVKRAGFDQLKRNITFVQK
jgi:epoxyqueuosine reductase